MKLLALAITLFSALDFSKAASCCGGGGGLPGLLVGDHRNGQSLSGSQSHVIGDTDPDGESLFRHESNREVTQTISAEGAWMISERAQAGLMVPWVNRSRELGSRRASSAGVGDPRGFLAWEYLPETEFSAWKPRGFLYLSLSAPAAPSRYDYQGPLAEDSRGKGFWTPSLGTYFLKVRGRWDFSTGVEVHQGFSREFRNQYGQEFRATPSAGGSALLGAGFSPKAKSPWRLGASLSPQYEGPIEFSTLPATDRSLVWDTTLNSSYMASDSISATLTYSDQTLWGPALNTTLTRTITLSLQNRTAL